MVLDGFPWYCMVLNSISWYCLPTYIFSKFLEGPNHWQSVRSLLASPDALEVIVVTYLLTYWLTHSALALTWLMWPWWVMIPIEDLTDVTLTKTQQVINKFSSKRVQDHATYLPVNMVCDWCRPSALSVVCDWSRSSALNISHLATNKYKEGNKKFHARARPLLIK